MKAVTWQGKQKIAVSDVPEPRIEQPTDAVVRVTSTAICGSDLHLYAVLAPFLNPGDILGHEFLGVVEEVGSAAGELRVGDRVVVPFNISCGRCWMCERGLQSQCETTQVTAQDKGAALFGYTSLYGQVPGGQAQYVRVPQAHYGPIVLPADGPDDRWLYLSDILPTAWQGVRYCGDVENATVAVLGLGPVGQLVCRVARHLGAARVIGVDLVPERLATARTWDVETVDLTALGRGGAAAADRIRELTDGRGADAVVDAVGMEAHGDPVKSQAANLAGYLPGPLARAATETFGVDSTSAMRLAFDAVRRGGTVSLSGVYGGAADPVNMMQIFDKQITLRMGQANVRRWSSEIFDIVSARDVFGLEGLATHRLPLSSAPEAYDMFQKKRDGCLKVILDPWA